MRETITQQKDKCSFILGRESRCPYNGFKAPFNVIVNKSGTKKMSETPPVAVVNHGTRNESENQERGAPVC